MKHIIFMGFLLSYASVGLARESVIPQGESPQQYRRQELQRDFIKAVKDGDNIKILSLLEQINPRFTIDKDENTPLHLAAALGRYKIVEMLIRGTSIRGGDSMTVPMDPNQPNKKGLTPLHFAVRNLHPQVVRLLITKPYATAKPNQFADPTIATKNGNTPLDYLVSESPLKNKKAAQEIVIMLIPKMDLLSQMNAFTIAARKNHIELVELFLYNNISPNRKWVTQKPLTHKVKNLILAYLDAYDVIDLIKKDQKKLNETLRNAAKTNNYILAKLALKYGADKSAKSKIKRQTAYDLARKNNNPKMMELVKP